MLELDWRVPQHCASLLDVQYWPRVSKVGFWAQELVEASSNRGPTLTVSCQAWAATEELARRVVVGQALQAYEEHETTELS